MATTAEDKIRQARSEKATSLDLSNSGLQSLPAEIGKLTQLQGLDLMGNGLQSLPAEIGKLTQLQTLDLVGNRLQSLPAKIGQLTQLQTLDLRVNGLQSLPTEIGKLTQLQTLDLRVNGLQSLPAEIGKLTQLQTLYIGDNDLQSLPAEIGKLTQLQTLDLRVNDLQSLPAEIGQLTQLQTLDLSDNDLQSLPAEIGQLTQLQTLDLSDNDLQSLPAEIRELAKLEQFLLHKNEALKLPPEILGDENLWRNTAVPAQILEFYFRSRQEPSQALLEAKILVVGQGGVGKSSLVKRLAKGTFDPNEQRTEGIDIVRWQIETERDSEACTVRLNIWDFGGQEIMHATHQFFLTKRSLYLLVLDARKGENESNLFYWLRLIQSFAANSPVLVVINKSEGSNLLNLNERRLLRDYSSIRGFLKTSCSSGLGIGELKQAISRAIQELDHVFDMVPASFFAVKEVLEKRTREEDVLEVEDYESLCVEQGIIERSDQTLLLRFLHDLGSVLHFKDPDSPFLLEDTHVLNPQWVTHGVYKILNEPTFMRAGGEIKLRQLARVLKAADGYPKKSRLFIIGMMQKFELCFEFPEEKALLVPELLPANEPDLGWEEEDALRFEYHYPMLPDGILPRFIVRTQAHRTDKPTYWRSGVLLQIDGNRTLVRGDTQLGRVFIAVRGPRGGRRQALSVVRAQFREIHQTVPGIDPQSKVPLSRDPGRVADYAHLRRLEDAGVHEHLFEGADQPYSIRELLDGVESRDEQQPGGHRPVKTRRESSTPELFLSYAWGGESETIAGEIEQALTGQSLRIVRDKRDLAFKGSIRDFMQRIGEGRGVVLVISDKYLKSENCMFELVEVFEQGAFRERIFPLMMADATIYKPIDRIRYVKHWRAKKQELNDEMQHLGDLANLDGITDDLNLYDKIADLIAKLTDVLRDMNTLNVEEHRGSGFSELIAAVRRTLQVT